MTKNGAKRIGGIADLKPDSKNANRGTQRGRGLLEKSLRQYGAGRSVLADREGNLIAGNKTVDVAAEIDLPVRVVQTDGNELVVVQRTDLDLDSNEGRRLAIADNRTGETGLEWNTEAMLDLSASGIVDLEEFWKPEELEELLEIRPQDTDWDDAFSTLSEEDRAPFQQMKFILHDDQVEIVKNALEAAKASGAFNGENKNNNGNALARVCDAFVEANGRG